MNLTNAKMKIKIIIKSVLEWVMPTFQ